MSTAYGLTALISLCMVGVCVMADKKRDVWLLFVFASVSVCNLGYFMMSVSKVLGDALNSNRLAYLGSVFLPFFMLMMVLRFCGIKRRPKMTAALVTLGIIMLGITTSPGILPIYYSTVDIEFVNGTTKLVREYGPFHLLYYVYLIGYMLSMIGVTLYAIGKKKIKSRIHTVLLLFTVFCNIAIWLAEQFLPRGFEWLSVSYIVTECLILVIYRSMQKQGHLIRNEKTQTYTINVLLTVFLLLFANFIRVVTKGTLPVMFALSNIVALIIHIGILVFWGISVYDRIINKAIRRHLTSLVCLMMLWMLLQNLRYTVFFQVLPYGQWCWYAYYISMLLIPQLCLISAKYIGKPEDYKLPRQWKLMYIPSLLMIVGFLTNDIHKWAFRFPGGYELGWDNYSFGPLFYVAITWVFGCIALMIAEFLGRCRIPKTKKFILLPIALLGVGTVYSVLYVLDAEMFGFLEMYVTICFLIVAIWESSIKIGLIQSNSRYDELLRSSCLGVSVIDTDCTVHYRSDDAPELTPDQMRAATKEPIMPSGGIRVSGSKIRGGYALWQEDLSELMDNLDELKTLREGLKDSNAVAMQNYQMDKRLRVLAEKNRLHDVIHRQTAHQINLLGDWLGKLQKTSDEAEKRELLRRIVVVGTYLKRRNNLILVSEQDGIIKEEELKLSIREMMKNLQLAGVDCASSVQFDMDLPAEVVMKLFDFCEFVIESSFDGLERLLARFFCRDGLFYCCVDAVCSLDLTSLRSENVYVSTSDENYYTLSFKTEGGEGKC